MKKTMAILLTFALVICMVPSAAFADVTAMDVNNTVITLSQNTAVYNGQDQAPTISNITVSGTSLTPDQYNPQWSPTSVTNVGSYTLTVTGANDGSDGYSGTATKAFTITALNLANATITEKAANPITTTTSIKDNIEVKYNGKTIPDTEYTVTSEALANGMVRVKVAATTKDPQNLVADSYRTADFYVKTNLQEQSAGNPIYTIKTIPNQTYTGSAIEPAITILKDGTAISMTKGTDYSVTYTSNVNGGQNGIVSVTGIGKYTGTITADFHINQRSITTNGITAVANTTKINGQPIVVVKDGSKTLQFKTDYTLSTVDTTKAGSSSVIITGVGNYTGTRVASFAVVDKELSTVTVNLKSTYYNGAVQQANITVKGSDGATLNASNYSISYTYTDRNNKTVTTDSPKDAGTYSFTIIGKGAYAGTLTDVFTIQPVPLDWAEITLGSSTVLYNGIYVPKVNVKHISGSFYFNEADYTVLYSNLTSTYSYLKPTATVSPVANGNLTTTGSTAKTLIKEFSLATRSISNCLINFTDYRTSKSFDGSTVKPTVTVKDTSLNKTLTSSDYTVTYKNSSGATVYGLKEAGTYSVVITGIGAYSGSSTLTYTIIGTDISRYTVTLSAAQVAADGYNKYPSITSVAYGVTSRLSTLDYTVTYQDSTGKTVTSMSAPGVYKVVVTGKNGYSGSTYATFTIKGLPQTVTAAESSYKVYPTTETFKIPASATGDGTGFTYTSSNPTVASVSALGYVTMHKMGRAVITISTTGTKKYDPASDTVVIKVYPRKSTITQKPWTSGKKAQFKVRWTKQEDATRYEVRYSRNKSFKKGTYITKKVTPSTLAYTTQSTTIKNLKRGYTYYVKVRAVKEVYNDYGQKLTYYGSWSGWRSVRTK